MAILIHTNWDILCSVHNSLLLKCVFLWERLFVWHRHVRYFEVSCWFYQDVLEFVDCGCNGFLSNICLVIASYNDMFLSRLQDEYVHVKLTAIYVTSSQTLYMYNLLYLNFSKWISSMNAVKTCMSGICFCNEVKI